MAAATSTPAAVQRDHGVDHRGHRPVPGRRAEAPQQPPVGLRPGGRWGGLWEPLATSLPFIFKENPRSPHSTLPPPPLPPLYYFNPTVPTILWTHKGCPRTIHPHPTLYYFSPATPASLPGTNCVGRFVPDTELDRCASGPSPRDALSNIASQSHTGRIGSRFLRSCFLVRCIFFPKANSATGCFLRSL